MTAVWSVVSLGGVIWRCFTRFSVRNLSLKEWIHLTFWVPRASLAFLFFQIFLLYFHKVINLFVENLTFLSRCWSWTIKISISKILNFLSLVDLFFREGFLFEDRQNVSTFHRRVSSHSSWQVNSMNFDEYHVSCTYVFIDLLEVFTIEFDCFYISLLLFSSPRLRFPFRAYIFFVDFFHFGFILLFLCLLFSFLFDLSRFCFLFLLWNDCGLDVKIYI